MKLIIKKSSNPEKKFDAIFDDDGHTKKISFGAAGYPDFTQPPHDEERKKRYLKRHNKHEHHNDPKTAGALSKWILWYKPSLKESIRDFKHRFNLE